MLDVRLLISLLLLVVLIISVLVLKPDGKVLKFINMLSVACYFCMVLFLTRNLCIEYESIALKVVPILLYVVGGLLTVVIILLSVSKLRGISKSNSLQFSLLIILLITLSAGYFGYYKTSISDDLFLNTESNEISDEIPLTVDRVKQDISLILSMYDNSSYQQAKSKINYGGDVTNVYFRNEVWNSYSELTSKPDIVFKTIGVDYDNEGSYYAVIVLTSNINGKPSFKTYFITATYDNDMLVNLIKRKV